MKNINFLFYGSIFLGIFIWFFFIIITPIEIKSDVSYYTILFILLSYLALIIGFISSSFFLNKKKNIRRSLLIKLAENNIPIIKIAITIIIISFMCRYFDLFYNRGVDFGNAISTNKFNASNPENFSFTFMVLSFFRSLYFIPLIFYYANRLKNKTILYTCILLFLLPFLESYLRGSRRIVFESLGLLTIIFFVFNKVNFKSYKTIVAIIITLTILFAYSFKVLKSRISENNHEFYSNIFDAQYNEFVPPKEEAIKFMQKNERCVLSHILFSEINLAQYITHGVFEMDYMISTNPGFMYGKYNFYLFVKFLNKLGLSNVSLDSLNNPTKRITYITFFGGMYLDFGWYSLAVMFLFGIVQNKVFVLSKQNYFLIPLSILFVFSNSFMLIFNFIRVQFVFTLTVYLLFVILLIFIFKIRNSALFVNANVLKI